MKFLSTTCESQFKLSSSKELSILRTQVLFFTPVIQIKKSQFHIKELFPPGIRSMAEFIPPKESVPRNGVPTTMNV
jgi:hypothetical protein